MQASAINVSKILLGRSSRWAVPEEMLLEDEVADAESVDAAAALLTMAVGRQRQVRSALYTTTRTPNDPRTPRSWTA